MEFEEIRHRFESLNPYEREAIPDLLRLTDENFLYPEARRGRRTVRCFSVSAKRYALFVDARDKGWAVVGSSEGDGSDTDELADPFDIVDGKEHGLAQLLNPIDPGSSDRAWIGHAWELMIRTDPGLPRVGPDWLDRPALARITCSSPDLVHAFDGFNRGSSYADSVKPFNFMLVAYVDAPGGFPTDVDRNKFVLVAPYEPDPARWTRITWFNRYDPEHSPYRITTIGQTGGFRLARVKTYRDVLADYLDHPEPKNAGPDGEACTGTTVGLLGQRLVAARPGLLRHIGKESNDLERRIHQLVADEGEYLNTYADSESDPFDLIVRPILEDCVETFGVRVLAERTELNVSTVWNIVRGISRAPRWEQRLALTETAGEFAHDWLGGQSVRAPRADVLACATYLRTRADRLLLSSLPPGSGGSPANG
ncbi:MAG: hypothetical protein ACJ77A_17975 [Actinomycetota bacterium]